MYREKSHHIGTSVNVPMNGAILKYGFQWLGEQNAADAVVVDQKSSASLLEHLVYMYDLLNILVLLIQI